MINQWNLETSEAWVKLILALGKAKPNNNDHYSMDNS